MVDASRITLRPLETREEYEACVRLQQETWGKDFQDVVPATILLVSQRVGGVAAGAFDPNRRLLGFVFGISGVRDGKLVHWSDMLAVRSEARRSGLGKRLKLYQRDLLQRNGVTVAFWSFDPLVAGNAKFNLDGLGAVPVEYVVNMYGDTGSILHSGLDTDRLVVEWHLSDRRVKGILAKGPAPVPAAALDAPIVNPDALTAEAPHARGRSFPRAAWVRVAVPPSIEGVKATAPEDARLWQLATRRAFQWYLGEGYRVAGFQHAIDPGHPCYLLTNEASSA